MDIWPVAREAIEDGGAIRRRRSCPNCAQFVKEGKGAIKCTRLSCRSFAPTLFAFSFAPWRTTLATSCGRWRCRRRRSRGR
jgi:hypothetical protein